MQKVCDAPDCRNSHAPDTFLGGLDIITTVGEALPFIALFVHGAYMGLLSPLCARKQPSAARSKFMGSRPNLVFFGASLNGLPLLPATPMPWCPTARSWRRAEFRA